MQEAFSSSLFNYLKTEYPRSEIKLDKRSWLKFEKTGTLIYVNGSKKHDSDAGWYDLDESIYKSLMSAANSFQAIILGSPNTAFVMPKKDVEEIFGSQPKLENQGNRKNRWMFSVIFNGSKYFLVFSGKAKYDITEYLNKWKMIPELGNSNARLGFKELQRFLLNEMQMQANYQPIMLKALLEGNGRASRNEIADKIKRYNRDKTEQDFRFVPVYDVLEKHGLVRKENDQFILNTNEITPNEREQLIALCNWKTPNSAINLAELITAFNGNMNLFDPDGYDASRRNEQHEMFVRMFPRKDIKDIQLDQYVTGKPDPKTGSVNKSTFCYLLEFGLPSFGGAGGRQARKFGIYYSNESNEYVYDSKYSSIEEAFDNLKDEIDNLLRAAEQFHLDRDWKKFSDRVEGHDYDLYRNIRSKIVTVYFPQDFLNLHVPNLIDQCLSAFGVKDDNKDRLYLKEEKLLHLKMNHNIMKLWDNGQFSHFLWRGIIKRDNPEIDSASPDTENEPNAMDQQQRIFVSGYDRRNLEISLERGILGWANNSKFLSVESLVFVFNKDSLVLETCFEITSRSTDKSLVWADEKQAGEIIYGNRWNAKVLYNNLDIQLQTINSIPPFDREKFQGLLRGNFPMPLDTPSNYGKYTQFREFLLDKIQSVSNYWIFVVSDQESQSGEEIYQIRMKENFWGLNQRTAHRKHLKKGDKVIFSHGSKTFLGTATLDSDSFELDNRQKGVYQHGIFKNDYGVLLSNIVTYEKPKKIEAYIDRISFATNKQQYPVYFQGGIRKISREDYLRINDREIQEGDNNYKIEKFEDSPLEFPSQSRIDIAIDSISNTLLVSKKIIMQVLISVLSGRHVILAGPVGTGKTTLAKLLSELFWQDDDYNGYYSEIYTATAEWSSQDVIGGMVPRLRNSEPTYEIALGCVSETVLNNWSESRDYRIPNVRGKKKFKGTWLVIDEFNRADIDKVFGQLFTSLETRILRVPVIEGSKIFEDVKIPLDYRIICTLNTADKHYLFKLSDALKRRFAYIELFPPERADREREIYYALKNGLNELAVDFSNLIVLNANTQTIDPDKTDERMLSTISQAYDIFDVIRMVKPLGTAILKSIYQSLLVGVKVTNDYDNSLDTSINSNLVPQLESMNGTSLESIFHFLFQNPVEFFRQKHSGNDRDQYQGDFRSFLEFISVDKQEQWTRKFLEKIDDPDWDSLKNNYSQYKKEIKCPLFKNSLHDLVKASLI